MCNRNVLICPKCKKSFAKAALGNCKYKVFYFTCFHCNSNVVFYNNKLDIISDACLNEVLQRSGLYGTTDISMSKLGHSITADDILDLKTVLESAESVESFIKKI